MGSAPSGIRKVTPGPLPNQILNEQDIDENYQFLEDEIGSEKYKILDDVAVLENTEKNKQKTEIALEYLFGLKSTSVILKNKKALKIASFLNKLTHSDFRECLNQAESISKFNIAKIFSDIFADCFEHFKLFLNQNEYLNDAANQTSSFYKQLKIKYFFVTYLSDVVWYWTEILTKFRFKFHHHEGTQNLINYLSDNEFVLNCLRFKSDRIYKTPTGVSIIESFMHCIHNLSKIADSNKNDWEAMNATQILMKFSKQFEHSLIGMLSCMTIANIIKDEEMEMLPDMNLLLTEIIKLVYQVAESIVTKRGLRRIKLEINDKEHLAATVIFDNGEFNIVELIDSLTRIAVNDKMKFKIYHGIKSTLKDIIIHGNELEKEYSTKLLWQLCFDSEVTQDVSKDKELVAYLNELNRKENENQFLRKNIFGIIWMSNKIRPQITDSDEIESKLDFLRMYGFEKILNLIRIVSLL